MFPDVPPECFYGGRIVRGYPSIHLSIYLSLSLCLSVCLSVCLSIYLSVYLSSTHYAVVDLFSDDLQSLGEPETRSQLCQRFPCSIVHHLVVTVSDYEPCEMVITWQLCGKLS